MKKMIQYVKTNLLVLAILFFCFLLRLIIAHFFMSGFDPAAWGIIADLVLNGKNPYVESLGIYSFSPLWMGMITLMKASHLPFYLIVSLADVFIAYLIYKETKKISLMLFYILNPISFYVTSLDGNFDPLMIAFLFLSYIYFKNNKKSKSAIFFAFAILFKQAAILLIPVYLKYEKTLKDKIRFLLISLFPFIISLLPFFLYSPNSILKNVIFYHPGGGWWGYDVMLRELWTSGAFFLESKVSYIIIILMLSYFLFQKKKDILGDIILLFSGFYFLKSVGGAQYLLWILPFAILKQDKVLYPYTLFSTIYLYCGFFLSGILTDKLLAFLSLPAWLITAIWFKRKINFIALRSLKILL